MKLISPVSIMNHLATNKKIKTHMTMHFILHIKSNHVFTVVTYKVLVH